MLKDLPVLMEAFESVVEAAQRELRERTCPCDVAEVEVGREALNDFSGNETFNRRNPHLGIEIPGQFVIGATDMNQTFISALESSPVHCWKLRPCLKRRRPGNGGASAILHWRISETLKKEDP